MEDNNSQVFEPQKIQPKCVTAKLVIGILSMVFFILVTFQSCAAGLANSISRNGDNSGATGFVVALNFLISGIVAVAARKSIKLTPWIINAVLLWLSYFFAKMMHGIYTDLVIWGFLSFAFGVFYLLSSVRTKKGYLIVSIASVVYLVIALL